MTHSESAVRLLLVEDEALLAFMESTALASSGYDVALARSGEEAVEAAAEDDSIRMLVMDVDLGPGIDGIEAAKAILAIRPMPLLFLTSCSEREVEARAAGIEGFQYLGKNESRSTLLASVDRAIAARPCSLIDASPTRGSADHRPTL
jgi:CheY-like chemotaxis protein